MLIPGTELQSTPYLALSSSPSPRRASSGHEKGSVHQGRQKAPWKWVALGAGQNDSVRSWDEWEQLGRACWGGRGDSQIENMGLIRKESVGKMTVAGEPRVGSGDQGRPARRMQ